MNKILIISLVLTTVLLQVLIYLKILNTLYVLSISVLVAFYFFVIIFFIKTLRDKENYKELASKHDEYSKDLSNFITILRTERHDYMNHFNVLGGLLSMGKTDMANVYLKEVVGRTKVNSHLMVLKQPVLIALLNGKINRADSMGIKFNIKVESSMADLSLNSTDVTAIFGNLVDNAVDAACDETRKYAAFVSIHTREDPEAYIVSISNSGPPIQEDALIKIFETGFSTKGDGRGFGLGIVLSVVEKYGGNITISSEPTTFTVVIPRESKESD